MSRSKQNIADQGHFIVAIGASAGGLEAIHEFFDNMPSNGNLSFIIIQHLSPDYKSLLVELISKHTNMQVYEATHGAKAESNCVYVIPNNKLLTIKDGHLQLGAKNFEKVPNTAIDTFLHSLAEDQAEKAMAIILSGTGSDGSKGIQSIKQAGGMVLVQDPLSAKFDGMPNTAIATGFADLILAPELMPEEIFNYINERPVHIVSEDKPDESLLPEVLKLIEKHCSYDFHNYKTPTILRRIARRMGLMGYKKFTDYLEFLRISPEECRSLGKEFLIGVTKFFRDSAAFQLLRAEVLPDIINSKNENEILKIWVTACSTGEEAYSLAILIDDLLQRMGKALEVKIFASDLDIDAIEFASKATYPSSSVVEIAPALVNRYFIKEGSYVVVQPRMRKQIVFARHNVLKDPPFIKNDMVTCRNMLIYMNNILQRKVLSTLQFSLNAGGYLFLGPSETPATVKDGFEEVNGKWKIFRKITNEVKYNPERLPSAQMFKTPRELKPVAPKKEVTLDKELADDFRNVLVGEYGFAAIYIDKNFEIREAIGDFKKYLSLPAKILSLNILRMVNGELAVALNAAIRKALREKITVSLNNIRVQNKDKNINIFVRPASKDGHTMIVLGENHEALPVKPLPEFTSNNNTESLNYIAELEDELKETRSQLQMAIESLETANEELQSSNEELLSANEELQSSNEELQSLNEELHTLNTEHQLRIRELIELNDDLNNYFRSTDIAQVFVDSNLRIRKFNPVAVKMINLIESDIGRPIEHISTNIRENKNFIDDIQKVLKEQGIIQKEVVLSNGNTNLMKILPYIRQDKQVDGVVITFIDISAVKELNNIVNAVFNSSISAIMALKAERNNKDEIVDFNWIAANYATDELLNLSVPDYSGKSVKANFPELVNDELFEKLITVVNTGVPLQTEIALSIAGNNDWFDMIVTQMMDGIVISLTNINDKKKAEEKFRNNYFELMKTKENYRNLNIALEDKVKERTFELTRSEERFRLIANVTNDAIWDWDLVNNKIWWSDSFYNRFDFEKLEHKLTSTFWISHIHPDDRERVTNSIYAAINDGTKNWSERFRFEKKDGTYAVIQDKGTVLLNNEGTPYRMVGSMVDITEAEAAEQKLKATNTELQDLIQEFQFVTDFMPQMVWSTQPGGHYDFFNKGWYDYTGLTQEDTMEKGWPVVLHPDDFDRALRLWEHSLQTGTSYEVEYRLKRYDGTFNWFLARAVPLKNDQGVVAKWFGTCTNINDQKLMNDILEQRVIERTEELQKINMELEASNSELLQFASVASHDLKEPLRKIHMFSNLVRDRYLANSAGEAMDYMNRIIKASSRMTKLINDLLAFTRLSGESSFELSGLNNLVEEVLSDLELSITEKKAIIEVGPMPEAEIINGQMRQVFQNIISNALKFNRPGIPPHIKISADRVSDLSFVDSFDANGEYCRITIEDNGIGFNNQFAEKIFVIFQRLHAWEKYDGTGIGLAITKKIIERHNGIITARSKEGEGSSFIIVIPLRHAPEQHGENAQAGIGSATNYN
jgi:two-component system, chemotaxis family, CheB/CheR fusion protein